MIDWRELEEWKAKRANINNSIIGFFDKTMIVTRSILRLEYFQFKNMISERYSAIDGLMFEYKDTAIKICFSRNELRKRLCVIIGNHDYTHYPQSFSIIDCLLVAREYIDGFEGIEIE